MNNYDKNFISEHWDYNYSLKKNLYKEDRLIDFRNNDLSNGLESKMNDKNNQLKYYNDLAEIVGENFINTHLKNKNIGNLIYHHTIGEKILDINDLFHIYWLNILNKKILNLKKPELICEIGGGYGCFAEKLIRENNCKYVMIDLPEANLLSSYYLMKIFQNKKFLLIDDLEDNMIDNKKIEEYDIIIIPPWCEFKIKNIDLFINVRSLMEMNLYSIEYYFNIIQKYISEDGSFLNINRYEKSSFGTKTKFIDYPYDLYWETIASNTSWKQETVHLLLTRRVNNENSLFKKDLKNIINYQSVFGYENLKVTLKRYLPKKIFFFFQYLKNFIKK
jgi:putative sugar O-methyltransferase